MKELAQKRNYSALGDLSFFGSAASTGILRSLNELGRVKQDQQGLLEFYKAKGMHAKRPTLREGGSQAASKSSQAFVSVHKSPTNSKMLLASAS